MPSGSDDTDSGDETTSEGNTPTVTCRRCDREWELNYELDELRAGNRAFEQFALDHLRHTGHFPDDVTPWTADCQQCPSGDQFLAERPARRWAETHARHTRHSVVVGHGDESTLVESE
ncbi:hypothetical protein SAMN04487949_3231 [Halogranum gelatinilyticum]|uniref:Uncharacterized protein n=1 Tax=Halogranum gelatinilyticum TaxID=660521 RepID=A0A1G9Y3Q4_9EURY|nr:hypothetical protein [Halogranum gelatinilyticum]SDN03113.1 hypothetical protein SAMN04487949_3231 [Halogranum gelatinilyticum]